MDEESAKGLQRWLKKAFRRLSRLDKPKDLEKEIQELIDEGEERGLISEDEGEMIQGIFSFRDTVAREIMVPRTDAVAAPVETPTEALIRLIVESGHSRIPIYEGSIDNIVGILHAKDLLQYWGREPIQLRETLRPPYFIPESKKISDVLRDLRHRKSHMAIVIDEYGGTAGILTMEDIIEEIIGDIMDEYDSEEHLLVEQPDGSILVDARLDIEELEDYLDVEFPEGKFESIGGFMISRLGRVPVVNEKIHFQGLEMVVKAADNRKIEKILIRRLENPPAQPMPEEGPAS
ncbi:magnesium and cobalt transporter [Desulfacinum hydrothermale DSM 13146]|uniref:Magnesium and cobalt transporter n=1 Tax=Desulfacinum hydrothermale DSM 13146 TaxID=1121390 RepID=A0A1W1XM67_9BACT|nr:hemolysin family protein [Desulfacinum hydrothermale]SMC24944.1 magnesium and cobalt transporter [Desulfacinum hydrothermale DSM 13146]